MLSGFQSSVLTVRLELHNLAWGLRKSGAFQSVRPDTSAKVLLGGIGYQHAERAERVFAWPLLDEYRQGTCPWSAADRTCIGRRDCYRASGYGLGASPAVFQ